MTYLFVEMLAYLTVAAGLGILVGWLFTRGRWQRRLEQLEEGWGAKQQLVEHQTARLNAQLAKASRERDQASSAYHEMEKELADLRLELSRAKGDLAGSESLSQTLSGEIQERRMQEDDLQRALREANSEKARQQEEVQRLTARLRDQEQRLQERQVLEERLDLYQRQLGEVDELREQLQTLAEAKREQEERAEALAAQHERETAAMRGELEELAQQNAGQRDALEAGGRAEQELKTELSRLTRELSTLRAARGAAETPDDASAPQRADGSPQADDLKRIRGIGPGLEKLLNQHGVWRFSDIARWQPEDVESFSRKLNFRGRIERDDWIAQARSLMEQPD